MTVEDLEQCRSGFLYSAGRHRAWTCCGCHEKKTGEEPYYRAGGKYIGCRPCAEAAIDQGLILVNESEPFQQIDLFRD